MKKYIIIVASIVISFLCMYAVKNIHAEPNVNNEKVEIKPLVIPNNNFNNDIKVLYKSKEQIEEPIIEEPVEVQSYSDEDLYILSHLIMGEAGGNSYGLKIGVGSVAMNRVNDSRFPDTLYNVVFQEGQYACTWDGNYNKEPTEECIEVAKFILENGSQMPSNVIWQAEFVQGDGIYEQIENTYFCYSD